MANPSAITPKSSASKDSISRAFSNMHVGISSRANRRFSPKFASLYTLGATSRGLQQMRHISKRDLKDILVKDYHVELDLLSSAQRITMYKKLRRVLMSYAEYGKTSVLSLWKFVLLELVQLAGSDELQNAGGSDRSGSPCGSLVSSISIIGEEAPIEQVDLLSDDDDDDEMVNMPPPKSKVLRKSVTSSTPVNEKNEIVEELDDFPPSVSVLDVSEPHKTYWRTTAKKAVQPTATAVNPVVIESKNKQSNNVQTHNVVKATPMVNSTESFRKALPSTSVNISQLSAAQNKPTQPTTSKVSAAIAETSQNAKAQSNRSVQKVDNTKTIPTKPKTTNKQNKSISTAVGSVSGTSTTDDPEAKAKPSPSQEKSIVKNVVIFNSQLNKNSVTSKGSKIIPMTKQNETLTSTSKSGEGSSTSNANVKQSTQIIPKPQSGESTVQSIDNSKAPQNSSPSISTAKKQDQVVVKSIGNVNVQQNNIVPNPTETPKETKRYRNKRQTSAVTLTKTSSFTFNVVNTNVQSEEQIPAEAAVEKDISGTAIESSEKTMQISNSHEPNEAITTMPVSIGKDCIPSTAMEPNEKTMQISNPPPKLNEAIKAKPNRSSDAEIRTEPKTTNGCKAFLYNSDITMTAKEIVTDSVDDITKNIQPTTSSRKSINKPTPNRRISQFISSNTNRSTSKLPSRSSRKLTDYSESDDQYIDVDISPVMALQVMATQS